MDFNLKTSDPSHTSLPVQIAGFSLLIIGCTWLNWPLTMIGLAVHFAGDVCFFFQLKARGAI